jgi:small subunit ribosomal protein S2
MDVRVSLRDLFQAGVHFGHKTFRWNPKMKPYIYTAREKIHIINLDLTLEALNRALQKVENVVSRGGRVLFVGTKTQARKAICESAMRCGQYFVNHSWLGGMLTNWETISQSVDRLKDLEKQMESADELMQILPKKEFLSRKRHLAKLQNSLGGIKDMGNVPDLLFIVDTNKERIAIEEARKLGIPIVAIVDTNSNPDGIDYPIPGNDDSLRSIQLYCRLVSDAVLRGIESSVIEPKTESADAGTQPKRKKEVSGTVEKDENKVSGESKAESVAEQPGNALVSEATEANSDVKQESKADTDGESTDKSQIQE